jgi:hypothetical protein
MPLYSILLITTVCMTSTSYQYTDGNANVYIITPDTLEYIPVKPQESSSSFYQGGIPKKVVLSSQAFQTLVALFEAAKNNPAIHIAERKKGSGMITTLSGSEKHSIILKPGSVELGKIEDALKELLT